MFLLISERKTNIENCIARQDSRDRDEKYFDPSCVVFENVIS